MNRLQEFCVKVLRVGLAGVFFVPLIYTSATIFPFIFPKSLVFRILIEFLAIPYIYLILVNPEYRPRRSKVLLAVFGLLSVEFLATLFGIDPLRSFWGNHERMMGFFMFAHVILFFLMATSIYRTKEEWRKFFSYAIIAGLIVTALGFVQYFSESFLHERRGGRIYSTFGNSIYLAAYLIFQMYLLFWYAYGEKNKILRLGLFLLLIPELLAFFWAHTRGATIALTASIFFFIIFYVYNRFKDHKRAVLIVTATPIILVIIFFLLSRSFALGDIKIFSVFNELNARITTAQTRLLNWQVGLRAWSARPLLGWGPENYYTGFNKFYNPKFYYYSSYETWQDHAHNFVVDTLMDSGILGLASFLGLFVITGIVFVRLSKKREEWVTSTVFCSVLVAYLVQDIFAFDTLGIWIMIYAVLGYAHIRSLGEAPLRASSPVAPLFSRLDPVLRFTLTLGFTSALLATIFLTNITPFIVSAKTISAGNLFQNNPREAYDLMVDILDNVSPYKAETRDEFAKMVTAILQNSQGLTKDDALRMMLKARDEYKKNLEAHPNDVYFNLNYAQWNMMMASVFEPSYYLDAEEALLKAKELSPKRQQIFYSLMRLYILRGRFAEAAALGREVVDLEKHVPASHWQYGQALILAGEKRGGYEEMKSALSYDWGSPYNAWIAPEMQLYIDAAEETGDKAGAAWWGGVLAFTRNNYKEAHELMARADKLGYTPNFFEQIVQYFNAADAIGKPHADMGMLKRFEDKFSKTQETELQTARIVLNGGDIKKARELLQELVAKYPGTNTAVNASVLLGNLSK